MNGLPFLALGGLLAVIVLALVDFLYWEPTRCRVCKTRKARWEYGDTPVCPECWKDLQAADRIEQAIRSMPDTVEAIQDYFRRHPQK